MNWLVPKPWSPWIVSKPLPCDAGSPAAASAMRASPTWSSGTASAPVAGSSLNGMRAVRSRSEASAVDLGSSPAWTGTKSGFWLQKNSHSPSAMATASSASRPSWRTAGMRTRSFRLAVALGSAITLMSGIRDSGFGIGDSEWRFAEVGPGTGVAFANPGFQQTNVWSSRITNPGLNRHVHDVLVGLDEAVAHLDRGPERDLRLLHRHHHPGEVGARVAQFEGLLQGAGVGLGRADLVEGVGQRFGESGDLGLGRAADVDRVRRRDVALQRSRTHLVRADLGEDR